MVQQLRKSKWKLTDQTMIVILYLAEFHGTVSVPALFDKKLGRIVSQDSADILLMLNSEFNQFCSTDDQRSIDLYPESKRPEIDDVLSWLKP